MHAGHTQSLHVMLAGLQQSLWHMAFSLLLALPTRQRLLLLLLLLLLLCRCL
jgi:hypothetical protein